MINEEEKLVELYKKCIDFNVEESFTYLENINVEELTVSEIVHIWNAISPKKKDITNWDNFVEISKNRMIKEVGEEMTENLMGVIL